ncbi:Retrovirus-related Pol polyprotein from transposon gypsy [Dictyocoela muelleri]|nr:Retrovirus-related Pol polyprotein from transposon gypsy [Dictyocoela muelleri]
MSSLAKEEQQVETNTYEPQRISFTITHPNTNISTQRSFSMLESIEKQDIFKWKDEIIQTQQLALWDESTTVGVVKASVSTEYLHLIHSATTLNEIWNTILSHKYPPNKYLKYLNQLANTHQNNFLTIKAYRRQIEYLSTCLRITQGWNIETVQHKINEAFFNGLSKRCQLEMARLNVRTCTDMYNLINATEETLIEQLRNTQARKSKSRENNKHERKKTYCHYHKVTTHDSKECRVLKSKKADTIYNSSGEDKTKNYSIKETIVIPTALEIKGQIQKTDVNVVLDTGSALSYINEEISNKLKLPRYPVANKTCVTVNGHNINSNEEVEFKIKIQNDICTEHKAQARIIPRMSSDLILGMDFMINHGVKINLNESTITIGEQEYEINLYQENNPIDTLFNEKTSLCSVTINEKRKELNEILIKYQEKNSELGRIPGVTHIITYNSNEIITSRPYRIPLGILKQTKDEIKRLIDLKIIQKSSSPFNSPALPILKRNGNVRLVIDYRKLIKIQHTIRHWVSILTQI